MGKEYLTVDQVKDRLEVSKRMVYILVAENRIKPVVMVGGEPMFDKSEIDRYYDMYRSDRYMTIADLANYFGLTYPHVRNKLLPYKGAVAFYTRPDKTGPMYDIESNVMKLLINQFGWRKKDGSDTTERRTTRRGRKSRPKTIQR